MGMAQFNCMSGKMNCYSLIQTIRVDIEEIPHLYLLKLELVWGVCLESYDQMVQITEF